MTSQIPDPELTAELADLRARLAEAEETLRAIRGGEVDALLIAGNEGEQVHLLGAGDRIYRQFIEAVSEGTATLSAGGEILSCNGCLAKTLRRPLDRVVGTAMRDHLSPDDYETFNDILKLAGPESRRRKIRLKTSEGLLVPVYLSATLLHGAGVAPVICLVFTDLEEVISAETTLRESEEEFRATFEQAAVGFAHATPDGHWLRVNQKLADIIGYTREELLTKTLQEITHPDDFEPVLACVRQVLAGAISNFSMEKRYIRKDTSIVWINITVSLVRKPSGEPSYFVAVIEDIMSRKLAEEALRESEARLRDLTFSIGEWVWEVDEHGIYTFSSQKSYDYFSKDVIGKTPFDFMPPDEAIRVAAIFSEIAANKAPIKDLENWNIRKNGERICLLTNGVPILDEHGNLKGYRGVDKDITERKRVETALRLSEERHRTILQTAMDGFWLVDTQGRLREVNETYCRMSGYSAQELLTMRIPDLEVVESAEETAAHIREIMTQGENRFESRHHRKDGSVFDVEVSVQYRPAEDGQMVTFLRDITEQRRLADEKDILEDQLRQAQKVEAIGQLAGGVAHDFNNMLAIILGYGEMLLGQLGPEDPARNWAEQIMAAGGRSASLTRQLLAFSRKQTLLPEVLDLNALLRNLEKMFGRVIGENIELEFKLAADLGRTKADPGQIEQVITNLVLNARDAMLLGGRLRVETANVELDQMYALGHESVLPGSYVMLAVTDTGCGMDKATMARLFEPFFTTKEKGKGTGLGLATAYGIVKQSGGYIWAYSEPDQGTTFKIYLPQTDATLAANAVEAGGEAPRGSGERILLVEDEAPLRELCETVLVRLGYRVNAAGNGLKALLLVQEQELEPDLVITDVIMPVMSGTEMTEQLRRDRPNIRVLYMSGYPDDTIARHGVLEPGMPFLQKPFTERALAMKVREALGKDVLGSAALAGDALTVLSDRRILMIDDDEQFRELVRHFCTKRGHVFVGVDSSAAALAVLAGQSFDVLLVDLNIPGTSGEHVLREIRAAGHAAPAIVLTGDVASADMDVLRPLGVVLALEKSSDAGPLLQAIEQEKVIMRMQRRATT